MAGGGDGALAENVAGDRWKWWSGMVGRMVAPAGKRGGALGVVALGPFLGRYRVLVVEAWALGLWGEEVLSRLEWVGLTDQDWVFCEGGFVRGAFVVGLSLESL